MNVERYLGVYYPVFHRTSVTRRKLQTLLAMLLLLPTTLLIISANDLVISNTAVLLIFMAITFPPFVFVNYNCLRFLRKCAGKTPEKNNKKKKMNNASTCLHAVGCILLLSIPSSVYVAFGLPEESTTDDERLGYVWTATTYAMNSTINTLIFFWKNKVLRAEGIRILKTLKDRIFGSNKQR